MANESEQYLRVCSLIVAGNSIDGLDLSQFRIKFSIKRSDTEAPNTADIRVYNLSKETALQIRKEFTHVILSAGYRGNIGVIFEGNIKQVIIGRETATDTFIDIIAGDGDEAYNFTVVNKTLAKNSDQSDQIKVAVGEMALRGVTQGHLDVLPTTKLPRGKTMYGDAKNYLRNSARTTKSSWSIQNGKVVFVGNKAYLPGEAVRITATSGMIGTPQQTNDGVNVKTLLNPFIQVSGLIQLENDTVAQQKLNLEQIALAGTNNSAVNTLIPRDLSPDGVYFVLVMEHLGDTRGVEWYTNLVCILTDPSANPINAVKIGTT